MKVRPATLDDVDVLVHQRVAMFTDMGVPLDASVVGDDYRRWLEAMIPAGIYRAWVVESGAGDPGSVVAGGGITILPWPPGPSYLGGRLAFVYNLYAEPAHRRQGLGRLVMETIHAWCRAEGISSAALNASREGQPLYEAMGYRVTASPMMFCGIDPE
jgi:GNAT superfamily N-acetyltransferase